MIKKAWLQKHLNAKYQQLNHFLSTFREACSLKHAIAINRTGMKAMNDFVYIAFAQAATCTYKHTRMHKQVSDKHVYHTLRDTHAYILRRRARSGAPPAARDLWENWTPPVLFIFPSRANAEPPSNWSRPRLLSLIQTLIAACLLFFHLMMFFCFFSPPPPSLFFPSQRKFLCLHLSAGF